jgi:hypothetical protein
MVSIAEINDPVEKFVAFIFERETVRFRRFERGDPYPWTNDPILREFRFTNIHREDDAVSQHYQKSVRNRYADSPLVLPGTVMYRWFNRISTCDVLFNEPKLSNLTVFEEYIQTNDIGVLVHVIGSMPPPHVTGSFIITGKPGYSKGEGVCHYVHGWCQRDWRKQWEVWQKFPPLLFEVNEWIKGEGLGSFMRGQIIADLKYLPFLLKAEDWWTWAAPGPGSLRGLNIVLNRPMDTPWLSGEWLTELERLSRTVNPMLNKMGLENLHNQDLQNCLCEWSKYTKTANGWGQPRQVFKNRV